MTESVIEKLVVLPIADGSTILDREIMVFKVVTMERKDGEVFVQTWLDFLADMRLDSMRTNRIWFLLSQVLGYAAREATDPILNFDDQTIVVMTHLYEN